MVVGAMGSNDIKVFVSDNSDGKITPKVIEDSFDKAGFVIAVNNNMNVPFKSKFKETSFDVYNLFAVYDKDTVMALAEENPEVGLISPMTMSIYTKKGDKTISVAHLSSGAMANIIGVRADNPVVLKLVKKLEDTIKKIMPNGKYKALDYSSKKHDKDVVTRVKFKLKGDDWEDAKDDFQMKFESELASNIFVVAGFSDLNFDLEDHDKEWYNFYDVYSVCKIEVIYQISKKHPEAGALGPCSMYMYQKKGDKKVNMAFTNVYKWIEALNIEDKKSLSVLLDAQSKFESLLTKLINK
jgi:uncharacterized protein (DUF302 family)